MANEETLLKADELVHKGIRLLASQRRPDALAALQEAVRLAPDHALGLLHLGLGLVQEERIAEALPVLSRALDLRPNSVAFHLFAGRAFYDAADYVSAQREFKRALELNAANDLARSYSLLTDWAVGVPEAAAKFDPDSIPDSTEFLARMLAMIEQEMGGRAAEYVNHGKETSWIDRPRIAYVLWRASMARKEGKLSEAAAFADMILEMQPGHPGAMAFQKDCRQAALGVARRKAEENPQSPEAHFDLAVHLAEAEQFEEADQELVKTRKLLAESSQDSQAESPEFLRLAGRVAYGLRRIDEAITLTRKGAEPGFTMAETHYYLGLCYLAQGRRQACFEEFDRLVSKVWWAVPLRYREYLAWRSPQSASCGTRT